MILMKKTIKVSLTLAVFALGMIMTQTAWAQERANTSPRVSPTASVSQTVGTTVVTVDYGRPSVNDREIMGNLVPYGQRWRAGADEATAITFSDDVLLEGEPVPAGVYSLHTFPEEDEWTIVINSIHSWGTQYDQSGDVVRVTTTPEEGDFLEQLMYYFENVTSNSAELILHWEETRVPITVSIP